MRSMTKFFRQDAKSRKIKRALSLVLISSFLSSQMAGCAAITVPDYPQDKPVSSYTKAAPVKELHIAIQPMTDRKEQEKYFGKDLLKDGVLPIYIMAENRHPSTSFILNKDMISLKESKEKTDLPQATSEDVADPSTGQTVSTIGAATIILIPLIFLPISLYMGFYGTKMACDATVTQYSTASQALYTHTLSPGNKVEGFVFFKIPDNKSDFKGWSLALQVREVETQTKHNTDFSL